MPCLFISGTNDPFGTPDELARWTATIPAPVEHVWIEGGRHDLKGADATIAEAVAAFIRAVLVNTLRRRARSCVHENDVGAVRVGGRSAASSGLRASSSRWAVSG